MSRIGIIDCGTTNSRLRIVDERGAVLGRAAAKIGVKDTAVQGSNRALREGLEELFRVALDSAGLGAEKVDFVISSGMITSELGILELPHLPAPAGLPDLARTLTRVEGERRLALAPELYLVRGVKNAPDPQPGSPVAAVRALDFMRGEETQIMGFLELYGAGEPTTIVNLSSHTKYISVDESGRIRGSVTTLSGQVYEAVLKETFIGKSVSPPANRDGGPERTPDTEGDSGVPAAELEAAMDLAADLVESAGFLRSLMVPRFLDTLMDTNRRIRKRFVESCLAADDLSAMNLFPEYGFPIGSRVVLVGLPERCGIFEHLLRRSGRAREARIETISDADEVLRLAAVGALAIARAAGLLG